MTTDTEMQTRGELRTKAVEKRADEYHLAAVLATLRPKERPYVAAIDAAILTSHARMLTALSVADCNHGLTARQEKRRERLRERVETVAGWYGLKATCHGDPRGFVVRLHGCNIPQNGWGEGFGL